PGAISGTDCISSTRTSTPLALLTAVRPRKPIRIARCRSDRWQVEVAVGAEQRAESLHVPIDSNVRAAGLLRAGRERPAYRRTYRSYYPVGYPHRSRGGRRRRCRTALS